MKKPVNTEIFPGRWPVATKLSGGLGTALLPSRSINQDKRIVCTAQAFSSFLLIVHLRWQGDRIPWVKTTEVVQEKHLSLDPGKIPRGKTI